MWKPNQSIALNSDTTKKRYVKSFSPLMQYIEEVIDESLDCTCNSYLHAATSMRECKKNIFTSKERKNKILLVLYSNLVKISLNARRQTYTMQKCL